MTKYFSNVFDFYYSIFIEFDNCYNGLNRSSHFLRNSASWRLLKALVWGLELNVNFNITNWSSREPECQPETSQPNYCFNKILLHIQAATQILYASILHKEIFWWNAFFLNIFCEKMVLKKIVFDQNLLSKYVFIRFSINVLKRKVYCIHTIMRCMRLLVLFFYRLSLLFWVNNNYKNKQKMRLNWIHHIHR